MTEEILDELITVRLLGSGFAALHMVLVKENDDIPYWDIQQTGIGRYETRDKAVIEARNWSKSEEIRLDSSIEENKK